uniref:Uncharacterized protein n=1 Tax=Junco hyemalis TaxID=40217 RepID=A0A8C5NSX7_JUNHY
MGPKAPSSLELRRGLLRKRRPGTGALRPGQLCGPVGVPGAPRGYRGSGVGAGQSPWERGGRSGGSRGGSGGCPGVSCVRDTCPCARGTCVPAGSGGFLLLLSSSSSPPPLLLLSSSSAPPEAPGSALAPGSAVPGAPPEPQPCPPDRVPSLLQGLPGAEPPGADPRSPRSAPGPAARGDPAAPSPGSPARPVGRPPAPPARPAAPAVARPAPRPAAPRAGPPVRPPPVQNLSHRLWQLRGQSGRRDSSPMNPNSPHSYG